MLTPDPIFTKYEADISTAKIYIKQLTSVVSPPAFIWIPYMTLANVTFDLDPRDL